jgi:hypothetical protein
MDLIENIEEMAEQEMVIYFGSNKQATRGSPSAPTTYGC